jgi:hypothetical protein
MKAQKAEAQGVKAQHGISTSTSNESDKKDKNKRRRLVYQVFSDFVL